MVARPLTVVQMLPDLNEGGVEQGTLEIGKALCRLGHRSMVISRGGRMVDLLESHGSRHITMPYIGEKTPRCLLHLWALRQLCKASNVDILHLRSRLPAWVGYLAWKSLPSGNRPRLVTTFHGFYSVNAYSAIMAKGEKIIAVSRAIEEHVRRTYKIPAERIEIIHRGVDPEAFDPRGVSDRRINQLRKAWGLTQRDAPILLLPARITRLKGHDLLVRALGGLTHHDWVLVCAGEEDPGSDFFQEVQRWCGQMKIADRVRFVGHCGDMPAAMCLANIIVSASTKPESFGRTIIEAQALERPVIAPSHGGYMETVHDGHTGWLFKPGSISSLRGVLTRVLGDPDGTAKLGIQGRRWVLERFTLSRMCRNTIDLYKRTLRLH